MIEKHCISLDLAKRLHELGIDKPSLFWWGVGDYQDPDVIKIAPFQNEECWTYDKMYHAYIATELLEMLPKKLNGSDDLEFNINIGYEDDGVFIEYLHYHYNGALECEDEWHARDKNMCNALAEMLIYLVENKLVEIK